MLDQLDDIAANFTAATIENLLCDINREPVVATAFRAWADMLDALSSQPDAATRDLILDPNEAGFRQPDVKCALSHG
jgi:hypothetical protein